MYNALKHGIFSDAFLLDRESRPAYQALLAGLIRDYQPVGKLEEVLVEKLAVLFWRQRRHLQAESAEVAKTIESLEDSEHQELWDSAADGKELATIPTALQKGDETLLECGLQQLRQLRNDIEQKGFDFERDAELLKSLFGPQWIYRLPDPKLINRPRAGDYVLSVYTIVAKHRTDAEVAADTSLALSVLTKEITRLELLLGTRQIHKKSATYYAAFAALVPTEGVSERLQRYEASLDRSIDRTLNQLERRQRMRLGQPVPPTLKVELSR